MRWKGAVLMRNLPPRVIERTPFEPLSLEECQVKMGLAGLRAFATVDSGMPTVTAARPFRWGWRCLGEQRDDLWSNLRTFSLSKKMLGFLRVSKPNLAEAGRGTFSKCEAERVARVGG